MSDPAQLYDLDFYRWTQEQAALLRQVPGERINLPIDWDHAAEEIEDMGRSDLRAVNSRLGLILEHLLKLQYSPAGDPRDGWMETVTRCRGDVSRILDDSPSLRRKLSERWLKEYALARRNAGARLGAGWRRRRRDPDRSALHHRSSHRSGLVARQSPPPSGLTLQAFTSRFQAPARSEFRCPTSR